MHKLKYILFILLFSFFGCTIETKDPIILKTLLIQFGEIRPQKDIESLLNFLPKTFYSSTDNLVYLTTSFGGIVPFPEEDEDHDYSLILNDYPWLDKEHVPMVWYYYNEAQRDKDWRDLLNNSGFDSNDYDLVIILSEATFEGLALYNRTGFGVPSIWIESYMFGGWEVNTNYLARLVNEYEIADLVNHEIGHFMGLGHSCSSCFDPIYDEECCNLCDNKDDVMSYCRDRPSTRDEYYNVFEPCHLNYIENTFTPSFLINREPPSKIIYPCD